MDLNINRILFPTDFSETSKKALPYALEIAKRTKAKLSLVHTIEEPYDFSPLLEEYIRQVRRKVETLFHDLLDEIQEDEAYKDLEIETRILNGRVAFALKEEADALEADLIVMGTTGASGLSKVLFGSKTTEVILQSDIPILAVPQNSRYKGLDHITFLTDYNEGDLKALEKTSELGKLFNSELSVLHIEPVKDLKTEAMFRGFRELVLDKIKHEPMNFELMIQYSFITGIADFLETQQTSLLAMVKYEKPFFSNLLSKNHSKELGFYTKVPLLIWIGNEPKTVNE